MASFALLSILAAMFSADAEQIQVKVGLIMPRNHENFGYGTSASAATIALERIRDEQLLTNVNFTFDWHLRDCGKGQRARDVLDQMVKENVDVLIGPTCPNTILVAGVIGSYYNKPLIGWAATLPELRNRRRFPTLATVIAPADSLGQGLVVLLSRFEWHTVAVLYNKDGKSNKCDSVYHGFNKAVEVNSRTKLYVAHVYLINGLHPTEQEIDQFLDQMVAKSRISIVCLDAREDRRKFMLHAYDKGLTSADYVYILPDYVPV